MIKVMSNKISKLTPMLMIPITRTMSLESSWSAILMHSHWPIVRWRAERCLRESHSTNIRRKKFSGWLTMSGKRCREKTRRDYTSWNKKSKWTNFRKDYKHLSLPLMPYRSHWKDKNTKTSHCKLQRIFSKRAFSWIIFPCLVKRSISKSFNTLKTIWTLMGLSRTLFKRLWWSNSRMML